MRGRLRRQLATRPWRPLPLEPGAVHVQCSATPRPPWQECIEIETHSALWMARPRAPEPCLRQSRLSRQQESELAKSYSQLQPRLRSCRPRQRRSRPRSSKASSRGSARPSSTTASRRTSCSAEPRRPWLAGLRPRRPRHASRPPRAVRWPSSTATVTTPGPAAATSHGGWSLGSPKASNSRTSPSAEYQGALGRAPRRWRALLARGCSPVAPAEQADAGRQRLGALTGHHAPSFTPIAEDRCPPTRPRPAASESGHAHGTRRADAVPVGSRCDHAPGTAASRGRRRRCSAGPSRRR